MADYNSIAAKAGKFLGAVATIADGDNTARGGATEDSAGTGPRAFRRLLANFYNPVARRCSACPAYQDDNAFDSYTITSTVYVPLNTGTGATGTYVHLGFFSPSFSACSIGQHDTANTTGLGIGDNSITTAHGGGQVQGTAAQSTGSLPLVVQAGAGRRTVTMLGLADAFTSTYYADNARNGGVTDPRLTYMEGSVMA